ncbi:hypothetical protein RIF25_09700 [Thermosynechococcaceae cyanobacterium BACA0444]|uniref:SPOR domain-containing protein n=1 Tax=Pseudocalidococcus azoricus BACA0444 TaxID=2918990 RepID=A0AAE4FRQ6_9CYAN|nr:hypothetical protein [Pseudocalidococcus azoricus]MDS3861078.1 hypothetical protein [Pseudocalidococcus azoricus BACA0444]
MTVTTPASPSEVQARLKAAVACLNLSLEAELTQYRCHRLVQSLSPFPAAAHPAPNSSAAISPTEAAPTSAQPDYATVAPVPEPPSIPAPVESPPEGLATSVTTFKQLPEPTPPKESPELAPESITELLAELETRLPQQPESGTSPLQAWFAPIFPKEAPDPVTPDSITVEETPGLGEDSPAGPFPEIVEQCSLAEDLFSEVPTLPKPAPPLASSPPPVAEPSVDEVWFDLGDFQPFDSDILDSAATPPSPATDSPALEPTPPPATAAPLSSPTVKQLDGPNTYFDSAAALLENIPKLDTPTPAASPTYLSRGLTIGLVLAGLMTTAGAMGYIWWQMRSEPRPVMDQVDPMNPTPGLVEPDTLPPLPPNTAAPAPVGEILPSPPVALPSPATATIPNPNSAPTTSLPTPAEAVTRPVVEPMAAPMGEKSFFYVVAPYQAPADLVKGRQGIANAYLVQFPEGVRIQFGAFEDTLSAQILVDRLAQQGIKSEVRAPQP